MSLAQKIQSYADQVESGTVADLRLVLKQMTLIPKQQITANQTALTVPIQNLTQAIQRNIKLNQNQIQNSDQIRRMLDSLTNSLPTNLRREVAPVIRNIQRQTTQAEQQTRIDKQIKKTTDEIEKKLQKDAVKSNDLQNLNTNAVVVSNTNSNSPIQQSVELYAPMFQLPIPQVTRPDQLPDTMKLLSVYAGLKGRKPVGSVTNKPGYAYVGIRTIDRGDGVTQSVEYQKNQIQRSQIPSIPMQLQYYANKTINNWNSYISAESRFVNFFQKVGNTQSRLSYVSESFKSLNYITYTAQVIATLNFYYVYLPAQKIALTKGSTSVGNVKDMFNKFYRSGDSPKTNPFLFGSTQALQLVDLLMKMKDQPHVEFKALIVFLERKSNTLNSANITKLTDHPDRKTVQARQFLFNNGVSAELADAVIANGDWSSVKKKKMILNMGFTNSQIVQLAKNATLQKNPAATQKILQDWNSTDILCHDYIWNWSNQ